MANNPNQPRGRGRPPKPRAEKQSECVMVRLTPADKRQLARDAKAAGFDSLPALLIHCWHEHTGRGEG